MDDLTVEPFDSIKAIPDRQREPLSDETKDSETNVAEPCSGSSERVTWWREAELAWLILLVVVAYFLRAGQLPLRGEEPTRAQIALEMVEGSDWLVPRRFGEPFEIRPPLQNWIIAASCQVFGSWSEWAIRFPSMLATLLTTLLLYGYSRSNLSKRGAFATSVAFATMADIFAMGRQAETEALFIFLVSASLISWHWGWMRRWPDVVSFALGYGFMALAMLTKGLQAPSYFVGSIGLFMVVNRQWRRLFSVAHLLGILVGVGILLAWVIPYSQAMGWAGVHSVWFGDPAMKVNGSVSQWKLGEFLLHLITLPLEVLAGALPWSLLLLPYLSRNFRQSLPGASSPAAYSFICLTVAAPTCWIPPGGCPRYLAPLFPSLAVLVGIVVERSAAWNSQASQSLGSGLRLIWQRYLLLVSSVMIALSVAIVAVVFLSSFLPILAPYTGSPLATLGYVTVLVGLTTLLVRHARGPSGTRGAVLAVAGFMVVTFSGFFFDVRMRKSENTPLAMQQLKQQLPPEQPLVSISGPLDSIFPFYYGQSLVKIGTWPVADSNSTPNYFCFKCFGSKRPDLPFSWKEIGAISLDRNYHAVPNIVVVVGCRTEVIR